MENFIMLGREDLQKFAKEIAQQTVAEWTEAIKNQSRKEQSELVRYDDAKRQLCKADSTLWQWHNRGYLVKHTIGHSVYYLQSDLTKLLRGGVIKTKTNNEQS